MPHSLSKIWIHVIFSTKDRHPLIFREYRDKIHHRIAENIEKQGCSVHIINGTNDHVHILILLSPDKSVSQIMKFIKGESSHWVNRQDFIKSKFAWQTGYAAFSVSESQVERVKEYIANQNEHHQKKSYQEEVDGFQLKYGLENR